MAIALLFAALASGCETRSIVNVKHSGHPERLKQVSTVEKAASYYSGLTYFVRSDRRATPVEQSGGQIIEYRSAPVFRATYFAADQRFYSLADGQDTIRTGTWWIQDNERAGMYPELCRAFDDRPPPNEGRCFWPYYFFEENAGNKHVHRGDTFGLETGQVPDSLREVAAEGATISSLLAAQSANPTNLATLTSADFN